MRTTSAAFVLTLSLGLALVARGDEVVMKDGTRLRGRIVSMDAREVVLEVTHGQLTIARGDVASVALGEGAAPAPSPGATPSTADAATPAPLGPPAAPAPAADAAETHERGGPATRAPRARPGTKGPRVLFLVDRSGSMAIGRRWAKASTWIAERVARLEPGSAVEVLLFDERVEPLWGSWLDVSERLGRRLGELLADLRPQMRFGTNIDRVLKAAYERECDRVILVTDGVVTRGGSDGPIKALERTSEAARTKGIHLDVVSIQDGHFHAPVEDLAAAGAFLERLARAGQGMYAPLPIDEEPPAAAYHPLPGAGPAHEPPVSIEVSDIDSGNTIVPRTLRCFPKFRVRVHDATLAEGNTLDVWEYGGLAWLEVRTLELTTNQVFDRIERLEFVREGDGLVAEWPVQVVGTEDHRYRSHTEWRREGKCFGNLGPPQTQIDDRYATVQSEPGATIELIYHRGAETFVERRVQRAPQAEVTIIGDPVHTKFVGSAGPAGSGGR